MDSLIVALVVIIAVAAHVALYRWVRFKMHEGTIMHYLSELGDRERDSASVASIAAHTALSTDRVSHVCMRSASIQLNSSSAGNTGAN